MIEICRRRMFATIAAGLLLPSCAPRSPSTLTISGPAAQVKEFVAEERTRAQEVKVLYEEGASEAIFEPSSGDEAAALAERATLKRLNYSFRAGD